MDEIGAGARFPCPCCGYVTFDEPPGSYAICPICFWEDDLSQLRFPTTSGANRVPLLEAQRRFQQGGACEERLRPYVRSPRAGDKLDPGWRLIDPAQDAFEVPVPSRDAGRTYPRDATRLYYWRPTYWRRG